MAVGPCSMLASELSPPAMATTAPELLYRPVPFLFLHPI